MVKLKNKLSPQKLLHLFADMCEKSRAPNGDWQGDGWGVSWIDGKNSWQILKSLRPIWENQEEFSIVPKTHTFVVHARSATFLKEKNIIVYNQPYIDKNYSFVFNGFLQGVSVKTPLKNIIGSMKIWYLLQKNLQKFEEFVALRNVKKILEKNSRKIIGMNIGLATNNKLLALCKYNQDSRYYSLHFYDNNEIAFICSDRLKGFNSRIMKNNSFITL